MRAAPATSTSPLTSLSDIPADPNWQFPSLTFDASGAVQPAEWISDLLTEDQKKVQGSVVDVYKTNPGDLNEAWNHFVLDDWDSGDNELAKQIFQQNDTATLMAAIRGH
jgi:hypothetical protein